MTKTEKCGDDGFAIQGKIGASIVRIGFWGILYSNYNDGEPPPNPVLIVKAPKLYALGTPRGWNNDASSSSDAGLQLRKCRFDCEGHV